MNELLYRNQGWIGGRLRKGRKQTYIQSVLAQCVIRWTGLWMFRTTSTETVPNQIEYPLMKMEFELVRLHSSIHVDVHSDDSTCSLWVLHNVFLLTTDRVFTRAALWLFRAFIKMQLFFFREVFVQLPKCVSSLCFYSLRLCPALPVILGNSFRMDCPSLIISRARNLRVDMYAKANKHYFTGTMAVAKCVWFMCTIQFLVEIHLSGGFN